MVGLIYIGGYGRSGSTLLEYLIATNPAVLACGEVVSTVREGTEKRAKCTCGRKADHCPVWHFFYSSKKDNWTHVRLVSALLRKADGHYAAVVDSSKTAWGSLTAPFRLKYKFGTNFVLIHLVREPTAVCWSVLRPKNWMAGRDKLSLRHYAIRCSWVVLGWSFANLSCELFGMLFPRQYLRLRYEDFTRSPTDTLGLLFVKLLPQKYGNADRVVSTINRHQLYGNKVRQKKIALNDVKEDLKWKAEMPPEQSRIVQALSYLLRLRYGYIDCVDNSGEDGRSCHTASKKSLSP